MNDGGYSDPAGTSCYGGNYLLWMFPAAWLSASQPAAQQSFSTALAARHLPDAGFELVMKRITTLQCRWSMLRCLVSSTDGPPSPGRPLCSRHRRACDAATPCCALAQRSARAYPLVRACIWAHWYRHHYLRNRLCQLGGSGTRCCPTPLCQRSDAPRIPCSTSLYASPICNLISSGTNNPEILAKHFEILHIMALTSASRAVSRQLLQQRMPGDSRTEVSLDFFARASYFHAFPACYPLK